MSGEAQILTWAVAGLLHCSNIPSFPYCVTGVFHRCTDGPHAGGDGPGARAIVQNKANFQRAECMLIAVQRKGYERKGRILLLQEQSQFPSLARGVPVGAWKQTPCGVTPQAARKETPYGVTTNRGCVQNKANFRGAKRMLRRSWEKGYNDSVWFFGRPKQSQFPGPGCLGTGLAEHGCMRVWILVACRIDCGWLKVQAERVQP